MPAIDAEAVRARRFAMLQRFMRAARFALHPVFRFRKARRGKTKATGGGRAAQVAFRRIAKRAARLRRSIAAKKPQRAPTRKRILFRPAPPRHDLS